MNSDTAISADQIGRSSFRRRSPDPKFEREFTLVQCKQCALVYIGEDRSPQEERALFGHDYLALFGHNYFAGPYGYKDYCGNAEAHLAIARHRLRKIESMSCLRTILDVECAMGFFLRPAEERDG